MKRPASVNIIVLAALVLLLVSSSPVLAQGRGFLDVSVSSATPASNTFSAASSGSLYRETATWSFTHEEARALAIDVGGGYFFKPSIGFGVAVSSTSTSSNPSLTATLPHPVYYNSPFTGKLTGTTALQHSETALHLQFVYLIRLPRNRMGLRLFGGPSMFSVKQDQVSDFHYRGAYLGPLWAFEIDRYDTAETSGTAWGFNAGADWSMFFSRNVGVGAVVRYAGASVTLPNKAAEIADKNETLTLSAGGFNIGAGLRVRF